MVNQYRYLMQKRVWSFVAGGAEHADSLEDAKRELKEEAGYFATTWVKLATVPTSPSTTGQLSDVYLATGLTDGEHNREAGEMDMESKWFTFQEVEDMIERNELSSFDITDFYLFKKHLAKNI